MERKNEKRLTSFLIVFFTLISDGGKKGGGLNVSTFFKFVKIFLQGKI